jgi:hypothetical protein
MAKAIPIRAIFGEGDGIDILARLLLTFDLEQRKGASHMH